MIEIDDLSSPILLLACLAALVIVGLVALHGAADSARRRRRRGPLAEFTPYTGGADAPPAPSPSKGEDQGEGWRKHAQNRAAR